MQSHSSNDHRWKDTFLGIAVLLLMMIVVILLVQKEHEARMQNMWMDTKIQSLIAQQEQAVLKSVREELASTDTCTLEECVDANGAFVFGTLMGYLADQPADAVSNCPTLAVVAGRQIAAEEVVDLSVLHQELRDRLQAANREQPVEILVYRSPLARTLEDDVCTSDLTALHVQ